MDGKVIDLNSRASFKEQPRSGLFWEKVYRNLSSEMEEVEEWIKKILEQSPTLLEQSLLRILYLQGERLYSALYLSSARLGGSLKVNAARMAASLETLNLALRTHDFSENRQKENPDTRLLTQRILCGDYLFSHSLALAASVPEFVRGMAEIICREVEAGYIEAGPVFDPKKYRRLYFRKISYKYASLLSLASSLGAWSSGMEVSRIELVSYYGHYLGVANKIEQDLMEFPKKIKSCLSRGQGKIGLSFPLIHILQESANRNQLIGSLSKEFWGKRERELWEKELDSIDYYSSSRLIIEKSREKARELLGPFPAGPGKDLLIALSREVIIL